MATANTIIQEALLSIGQLAEGELPSPETSESCRIRLNSMMDSWNNESLIVYQVRNEAFTLGAGQSSRTIGVGGNFNTTWPIKILESSYVTDSTNAPNINFPLQVVNQAQYNSIVNKTITGPYPQYVYYDRAHPLGTLYFWPVPVTTLALTLGTWRQLAAFDELTDVVTLPPGYEEALTFNLACRVAPSFGVEPSASVQKYAMESKRNIKRSNAQNSTLDLPNGIPGARGRPGYWDFYTGGS